MIGASQYVNSNFVLFQESVCVCVPACVYVCACVCVYETVIVLKLILFQLFIFPQRKK